LESKDIFAVRSAVIFPALLAAVVTVACSTTSTKSDVPPPPAPRAKELVVGVMQVYDFGALRLHAYQTNDPIKSESFLLETDTEFIGIETPAFSGNLSEYANYILNSGKPMNHLILVNHGNGAKMFKNSRVYATAATRAAMQEGGAIRGRIDNFIKVFGTEFNGDIPAVTDVLKPGKTKIGGVEFVVVKTKEGFDLEIPAINSVYTHMAGSHTHNILESADQINDMLRRMTKYKSKNYGLILTSHEAPESANAVTEKIKYLKKTKRIAKSAKTRANFIAAMKKAFPNYSGENYLEMTAGALFQ
jgi:hypothetical protein